MVQFRSRMREHQIEEKNRGAVEQSFVEAKMMIYQGTIMDSTLDQDTGHDGSKQQDRILVDADIHYRVWKFETDVFHVKRAANGKMNRKNDAKRE